MTEFIYKYAQLTARMPFAEFSKSSCGQSKKIHMGQLKLLISEIMFLSKKSHPGNKVLYVGAAEGYHTAYLANMFPHLTFDLWDPGRFHIEDRPNIKIFNRFFTHEDAKKYISQGYNTLFISDIRNLEIAESIKTDVKRADDIIEEDNKKQLEWVHIINPICAFLKFRPPYRSGKTEYLGGGGDLFTSVFTTIH
jgi:hypothetical protein